MRKVPTGEMNGRSKAWDGADDGEVVAAITNRLQGAVRAFASCRDRLESLGYSHEAGAASLDWAAALEDHGDWDGSRARIIEGTDLILKQNPTDNVYSAVMLLRTTRQFSATRDALPLERMIELLYRATFNPDIRL